MRNVFQIGVASLFVLGSLFAPHAEAEAREITVQVRSIAASSSGVHFDKKLDDLKKRLNKAFKGYSNFRQVAVTGFQLTPNAEKTATLPDGSAMTVKFHGFAGKFIKLGFGIEGKLNTILRATPGGTFFQAGLKFGDGILILAISVR
jgi:hypothetical protein